MKRLVLLLFLFWSITCFAQGNNTTKPILGTQIQEWPQGLAGYWLLNENSGTLVNDLSGNGRTGTITAATWAPGKFGPCLSFNGTSAYVTMTSTALSTIPVNANFCVSVWCYSTSSVGDRCAISWSGTDDLVFYPTDTLGGLGVRVFWRDVGEHILNENSGIDRTNQWHHFVFGSWGTTDHRVYVDGVLVATSADNRTNSGPFEDNLFRIGTFGTQYFAGQIDDVIVFSRALPLSEIEWLYRNPFGMFAQERPELYVTAAAPPAEEFQVIIVSRAAVPATILLLTWLLGRERKRMV